MIGPAIRAGSMLAARNPTAVARLTGPVSRVIKTVSGVTRDVASKAGLGKGFLLGTVASLGLDHALDAIMDDPETAQAEASALIPHLDSQEAREALIDLTNEIAALGLEGIPFSELPPEVAQDLIEDTQQGRIYGLPGAIRLPTPSERAEQERTNLKYRSLRRIFSVDQMLGLFMMIDIAKMENRLEVLDFLEENYQRR